MTSIRLLRSLLAAFAGIGHLRAEGKGYAWLPVDYNGRAEGRPGARDPA